MFKLLINLHIGVFSECNSLCTVLLVISKLLWIPQWEKSSKEIYLNKTMK